MLLRRVIGDVLRARRQGQHRTLREVSVAANVSLGYLSEIERGQKEASSELLAAICEALGSQLSEVLRDVTDSLALVESADALTEPLVDGALVDGALTDGAEEPALVPAGSRGNAGAEPADPQAAPLAETVSDGQVAVCVHRNGPLRTTLRTVRRPEFTRAVELSSPAN